MAAQRPNVIVYQEYENLTVSPDIPDLNVLIVGPCYQILDYLDDKDECYSEEYGELDSVCPLVTPSAVVIASPPNALPGIELDADSLVLHLDEARVVIVEDSGAAPQAATFAADDNLFAAHNNAAGVHFGSEEVAPGDILLSQSQATADYNMTVKEVLYVLNDYGATLDFQDGNVTYDAVQEGDTVVLSSDQAPVSRDGTYTVKRVRDNTNLEFEGLSWAGNTQTDVTSGGWTVTISVISAAGAVRTGYPKTLIELADYSAIRTTEDFPLANDGSNRRWRIERDASDVELDAADFSVEDNSITLITGITTDLSATLLAKVVSYGKIYIQYRALRTDLQVLTELSNFAEMETTLGKYDARNPLFVGAVVAKANTTTPISIYGVTGDTLPAYLDFIDKISSSNDVYAIVPLTYQSTILAALNNMCESLADPNYVLTAGIKQKFRVTIGAVDLITEKYMVNASIDGTTAQVASPAPTGLKTMTYSQTGGTLPDFSALGVVPGCTVEVFDDTAATTVEYVVAQIKSALVLEMDGVVADFTFAAMDSFTVKDAAGTQLFQAVHGPGITAMAIVGSALDKLYLNLNAPGGSFITSGVIPGDYLQIPENPNSTMWTTYGTWTVDEVLSQTRLRIVNNGNNTSELANELPHDYKRTDGSALTQAIISYRVLRTMTKSAQVDDMVAVASSFSSKRLLLCYPDEVDVSSLVDGSLTRSASDTPEAAAAQPGYYLSCAVGGLTAGKPPQQGFTNMGIAGIDRIYNSSEYFTEEQITELSNGGVYVFIQDTPAALPYSVHEVTTDVTALEFSEYMVVKDFDFVAWTYLDTLLPFIGEWNVIPTTIEFVRQALVTTGDTLKSRFVAKIGSPLTDYSIDSVAESSLSTDRIEAFVDVDLPMTLNTIGLHLVA